MKNINIRFAIIVIASLTCLTSAASACAQHTAENSAPRQGDELKIGILDAPSSLDPAKQSFGYGDWVIESLTHETLFILNRDGISVSPGLATEFKYVDSGNQAFEIALRNNAAFSDGRPVDASSVKTWFEYMSNTPGTHQNDIEISSIDILDNLHLKISLKKPNPKITEILANPSAGWGRVTSPSVVESPQLLTTTPAGAGQYKLDNAATVSGDHYSLIPNGFYYDKERVHFKHILLKVVKSGNSMLDAARSGQVDIAQGDVSTADAAASAGLSVAHGPSLFNGLFFLDRGGAINKAISDVRVRQALNYAVNREHINKAINGNYGAAITVWPTLEGHDPNYDKYYAYDLARARSLLAQAGYANGFQLQALAYTAGAFGTLSQAIAQDLRAIGVDLQITSAATSTELSQKLGTGQFPAFIGATGINSTWDSAPLFLQPGPFNQHGWHDQAVDALITNAAIANPQDALTDFKKIVARSVGEAYFVPIFTSEQFYYYNEKQIAGVALSGPADLFRPVVTEWYKR